MLCTHSYAWKQISAREARIRRALRDAGMIIDDDQVEFRDADQIALWVNDHPSVATWFERADPNPEPLVPSAHGAIGRAVPSTISRL